MDRYPDNSESFDEREDDFTPDDGFDAGDGPEFSSESGAPSDGTPVGPEWFDSRWLRANGAVRTDSGDIVRIGAPVLVLLTKPGDTASPGEEMDEALRGFGMLAWPRRRPTMVGTLLDQLQRADRSRRQWIVQNPFAAFWAATARSGPRRRRGSKRRA